MQIWDTAGQERFRTITARLGHVGGIGVGAPVVVEVVVLEDHGILWSTPVAPC